MNKAATPKTPSDAPTMTELVERAASIRPILEKNADETDRLSPPCRRERSGAEGHRALPADGAEAVRRIRDRHPHVHRGDGGARARVRIDGLGGQPDQRVRVAGRAVPGAGAAGPVERRPGNAGSPARSRRSARRQPVDGGWRVTGRWPWASGCLHAQWAACGIHMKNEHGRDGQPRPVAHADEPAHDRRHLAHGRHEGHRQQHDRCQRRVRARAPLPALSAGLSRASIGPSTPTKSSIASRSCRSPSSF